MSRSLSQGSGANGGLYSSGACTDMSSMCCQVVAYSVTTLHISLFRSVLTVVTLLSLGYLMVKLATSKGGYFPIYFKFMVITILDFFVVVLYQVVPLTTEQGGAWVTFGQQFAHLLYISAQWFVQTSLVFFMFEENTGGACVRRAVVRSLLVTVVANIFWIVSDVAFGCFWCGLIVPEVCLVVGFTTVALLRYTRFKIHAPRPAAQRWCYFLAFTHTGFLITYIIFALAPNIVSYQVAGVCLSGGVDIVYYLLYAPLLYHTLTADTSFWLREGAALMANRSDARVSDENMSLLRQSGRWKEPATPRKGTEDDEDGMGSGWNNAEYETRPRSSTSRPPAIRAIVFEQLKLEKLVGVGQYSEVFKSTWFDTQVAVKKFKLLAEDVDQEQLMESLLAEAALLSELRHPSILTFYGVCVTPPNLCMVTEFMGRGSLFDILRKQKTIKEQIAAAGAPPKPEVIKSGWLTKEGGIVASWKRRWFVLTADTLSYYERAEDVEPISVISLVGRSITECRTRRMPFVFQLTHVEADLSGDGARDYFFAADSDLAKRQWMDAIDRAASRAVHKPQQPSKPIPLDMLLTPSRVMDVMVQVAKGMEYLHSQSPPLLHRDLKSHNICINEDWQAKVCDFGISRNQNLEYTMSRVGTPQWMAPEVLREERYTIKADVFSFGVVLWELVTMDLPFPQVNPMRVITLVANDNVRLEIPRDAPPVLADLMRSCWQDDYSQRPGFTEVVGILKQYRSEALPRPDKAPAKK